MGFFLNKQSVNQDVYTVTFFLNSGLTIDVKYSKENLKLVLDQLSKSWSSSWSTGEEFGINFKYVTHYEIKKKESQ